MKLQLRTGPDHPANLGVREMAIHATTTIPASSTETTPAGTSRRGLLLGGAAALAASVLPAASAAAGAVSPPSEVALAYRRFLELRAAAMAASDLEDRLLNAAARKRPPAPDIALAPDELVRLRVPDHIRDEPDPTLRLNMLAAHLRGRRFETLFQELPDDPKVDRARSYVMTDLWARKRADRILEIHHRWMQRARANEKSLGVPEASAAYEQALNDQDNHLEQLLAIPSRSLSDSLMKAEAAAASLGGEHWLEEGGCLEIRCLRIVVAELAARARAMDPLLLA